MDRDKYYEIRNNLVLTYHSRDNLYGNRNDCDRTDISIHQIVMCILNGMIGFCGNKRMKKTYKGIETIYKRDKAGKYVIITYYRVNKNKNYQKTH